MTFRIARNGQIFGPYTEAEVRQYIASGNILLSDLAQAVGTGQWVPVLKLFPLASTPVSPQAGYAPGVVRRLFPDPPDLPWWITLVLGLLSLGIFLVIWDIVQAAWVRRVQPTSNALALYLGIAVVYVLRAPSNWHSLQYNLSGGPPVGPHHGFLLFVAWLVLYIASRHTIRQDLLQHFNGPEPLGLRLNAFFVYLLGGIYLQYHFNRINEVKRAMQVSVPA